MKHHCSLASLGYFFCSCVGFRGGLFVFEGRSSQSQEGCDVCFFKRNCAVHQVLKVGTWSARSTFSFYLSDVTHRHWDMFSIGPVVAAQQVV